MLNSRSQASQCVRGEHGAGFNSDNDRLCTDRVTEITRAVGLNADTRQSTRRRHSAQAIDGFRVTGTPSDDS